MRSVGGDLNTDGWMRLPFRFNPTELARLSNLGPHIGRGARLTNMADVTDALPIKFKTLLNKHGFHPTPNRAIGFVKSNDSNWSLPWHQDRVVAMGKKIESPKYSNWNRKSGVWHCEPTVDVLKDMAFAYIAFDENTDEAGGLELAVGTHRHGKILQSDIAAQIASSELITPAMAAGEVLLVSALTLHRSTLWSGKSQRRALRLDFRTGDNAV